MCVWICWKSFLFWCVFFICWDYISSYSMASGGHPHATLTMPHPSYSGEDQGNNTSSSPLAVWTAQVPALSASGVVNGPSDLCWQMVESGQQAVQLRRRRNNQKLFHLGRTLLLKHLPRDVNEHVNTIFHIKSFFFRHEDEYAKNLSPTSRVGGFTTLRAQPPSWPSGRTWEVVIFLLN